MKLHLPKMLLTAVLAAVTLAPAWGGDQVVSISDTASSGDIIYDSISGEGAVGRLLYAPDDTDGTITFTGDIDINNQTVWVGPGTDEAATTGQSTLVELSGIISNGGTLKLNEYSDGGGHAVYVLSNTANTFSGTVHLGHGGNANANVQLSLTANSLSSATVEFENKDKGILSVEANATILGLKGGSDTTTAISLVTSSSADNTLTLSGSGEYTYAGKIGTGNYISRDNFSTTSTATSASTVLNITKTGTGKQTFSSNDINLGTLKVQAGEICFTTAAAKNLLTTASSISVSANATFTATTAINNNTAGSRVHDIVKAFNSAENLTLAKGAYVKLTVGNDDNNRELRLGSSGNNASITLSKNFQFTNLLTVHGNGSENYLEVATGTALKFDAAVHVASKSSIKLTGGDLISTNGITLGHSTTDNDEHWGKLVMTGGSVKTGTITSRNQTGNAVDISGGSIEFTSSDALGVSGTAHEATLSIVGGATADSQVILKSETKDWTLDGDGWKSAKVGNVTIADTNSKNITLKNVTLDNVTNNKKLTLGSGVTLAAGATLGGTGTTTLAALLTNNGTIDGTLKIESLAGFEHGVGEIKDGNYTNNGFMVTDYTIIGGTNKSGVSVSYGGTTYTTSADGQIETVDRTHYQITNTTNAEKVSDINAISSVTKISMNDGTTLNVNTATSSALNLLGDATLNITNVKTTTESGITTTTTTLNHSAVTIASGAKATITGDGVYSIVTSQIDATQDAAASPLNVGFDSGWTGQVNLLASDTTQSNAHLGVKWLNLNHYGNENSTIKLRGVKGYLCFAQSDDGSKDVTFASDLILENSWKAALELSDGCSADHFIFSGNISNGANAGNFIKASSAQQDFTFTGDLSKWTGRLELVKANALNDDKFPTKNGKLSTITFKDNATDIGASILTRDEGQNNAHTVKAIVRIENEEKVEMKGSISHDNTKAGSELHLEVDTAKGTTFNKAVKVTDVTLDDASKAIFKAGLTAGAMKLGESAMLIANTELSSLALTAGAGSAVIVTTSIPTAITSITVTGSATLQAGGAESGLGTSLVFADSSKLTINGEGSVNLGGALTLGSNIVLNDALMTKITALEEGAGLALFNNVTALTLLADEAAPVALMSLDSGAIDAADVFSGLTAGTYTVDLNGNTVSINKLITPVTPNVPEPTTATLSLLALAGLAARRRRK